MFEFQILKRVQVGNPLYMWSWNGFYFPENEKKQRLGVNRTWSVRHIIFLFSLLNWNQLAIYSLLIFKVIYFFWFKMKHTLPGFGVTRFTLASASACLLNPFSGCWATWLRRSLYSKTLLTSHNGKTNRGRPQNSQRRKVEVTRWPK